MVQKLSKRRAVLCIFNIGVFCISEGKRIACMECGQHNRYEFEQWVLNMAVGILMIQREALVLHGSGLAYENRMIILCGESGSGKSTLADAMLADGFGFVADDSVLVTFDGAQLVGRGAYPLRRLCKDAVRGDKADAERWIPVSDGGREKFAVSMAEQFCDGAIAVEAVFLLQAAEVNEVQVNEVTGSEKLRILIECLYKKESYKQIGFTQSMMAEALRAAEQMKIYRLIRPNIGISVEAQKKAIYGSLQKNVQK